MPTDKTKTANDTFSDKVKKWYNGVSLVFKSTYNMGLLPYMVGTYLLYALLGFTSGILIFFTKINGDILLGQNIIDHTMVLRSNFCSMVTAFAIRCFYMNWIKLESQYFSRKAWINTQQCTMLTEIERQKGLTNTKGPEDSKIIQTKANSTVSETEKLIDNTHQLNQSLIQAFFAILSSCIALSQLHVPSLIISVCGVGGLILLGCYIQIEHVLSAKIKFKSARESAQDIFRKIFGGMSGYENEAKNILTATQEAKKGADEYMWYEAYGQGIYRVMTDISDSILTTIIVGMFIPSFAGDKGADSKIRVNFFGLTTRDFGVGLLLTMVKSLAALWKDASAILRASTTISEIGSSADRFEKTVTPQRPNKGSGYTLEETYRIFVNPEEKSKSFILWNALENLCIGSIISSCLCLYYDSMILAKLVNATPLIASTLPALQYCTLATLAISSACYLGKKYYTANDKNASIAMNYGNTIFSFSASSCLGISLYSTFCVVNPIATFSLIFTAAMPLMSAVAHILLVPNQKTNKGQLDNKIKTLSNYLPKPAASLANKTNTINKTHQSSVSEVISNAYKSLLRLT